MMSNHSDTSETTFNVDPEELLKVFDRLNENSFIYSNQYTGRDRLIGRSVIDWLFVGILEPVTELNNCSFSQIPRDTIVQPEELGIVMVVMCFWIWSCVLFYVRYEIPFSGYPEFVWKGSFCMLASSGQHKSSIRMGYPRSFIYLTIFSLL